MGRSKERDHQKAIIIRFCEYGLWGCRNSCFKRGSKSVPRLAMWPLLPLSYIFLPLVTNRPKSCPCCLHVCWIINHVCMSLFIYTTFFFSVMGLCLYGKITWGGWALVSAVIKLRAWFFCWGLADEKEKGELRVVKTCQVSHDGGSLEQCYWVQREARRRY